MTTLNEIFDTPVSNADFLCKWWKPEHCIPEAWESPSTHGIPDVELVGEPHMLLFADTTAWENPGRVENKQSDIKAFTDEVETKGIIPSRVIYYDVDDKTTVNGVKRRAVGTKLYIPGWMHQGVRFRTLIAKIRFANASNHVDKIYNLDPTRNDIEKGVREVLELVGTFTKDMIRDEVNLQGPGLTDKARYYLTDKLYGENLVKGSVKPSGRYQDLNNTNIYTILEELKGKDEWVDNIWFNDDEFTICVNSKQFEQRVGSLTTAASLAAEADKPLHIIFCVPLPEGKETLTCKRQKFFTMHMKSLEDRLMRLQGKTICDKNRRDFPWNHPDAQHRAIGQETETEMNKLIDM